MDDAEADLEEVRSTVSSMQAALDGINRNLETRPGSRAPTAPAGASASLRLSLPLLALKSPSMRGRAPLGADAGGAGAGRRQDEHAAFKEG